MARWGWNLGRKWRQRPSLPVDTSDQADPPTHLLIFEPEANGHQMEYIRHLLTSMVQNVPGLTVTLLTTAEARHHPNTARLLQAFPAILTARLAPAVTRTNPLFRRLGAYYERQWRHGEMLLLGLRQYAANLPSFVLVPHLESIGLVNIALRPNLFAGLPWATITIGARFHHKNCGIKGPRLAVDMLQRALFM